MIKWPVKVTLPNGIEQFLMMNAQTESSAILAARHYIIQLITEDGYLSHADASNEIEHYDFAIISEEEVVRLLPHPLDKEEVVRLRPHSFRRETIHQDTKDFASAKEVFKVGDEIEVALAGLRFTVVSVRNNDFKGSDNRSHKLRDLLGHVIKLTRGGELVIFKIEAIGNATTPYRWIRSN